MIAYQNMFDQKRAALYCRYNGTVYKYQKWHQCIYKHEMDGFLEELFDNDNNAGYDADIERKKNREMVYTENYNETLMEYINPNKRNFGIGWRYFRITNKTWINFTTRQLISWLTELYVRWIGYDYNITNDETLMDCMNVSYLDLYKNGEYLLTNSKRILLQYDYVLPFGKGVKNNRKIWNYYAKEIQNNIFRVNEYMDKEEQSLIFGEMFHFPKERFHRKTRKEISTKSLKSQFKKTKEYQLLLNRNKLDLKLFFFSQQIANLDTMFLEMIDHR